MQHGVAGAAYGVLTAGLDCLSNTAWLSRQDTIQAS
jgi:hypothetical protein